MNRIPRIAPVPDTIHRVFEHLYPLTAYPPTSSDDTQGDRIDVLKMDAQVKDVEHRDEIGCRYSLQGLVAPELTACAPPNQGIDHRTLVVVEHALGLLHLRRRDRNRWSREGIDGRRPKSGRARGATQRHDRSYMRIVEPEASSVPGGSRRHTVSD